MAKCPRCSGEMEISTIVGIELNICSSCRGIWSNAEDLEQILQLELPELVLIPFYERKQSGENAAWDPPPAFCPDCSAALNPRRFEEAIPVITQVCPNKHGLWLDQGELQFIKQFYDALAKNIPKDGVDSEWIFNVAEKDDEQAYSNYPISGEKALKQKGQLDRKSVV